MAGLTREIAEAHLEAWLEAELKLATAQEYEINTGNGSRRLKRSDLGQVREQILFWKREVGRLSATRSRISYVVPE